MCEQCRCIVARGWQGSLVQTPPPLSQEGSAGSDATMTAPSGYRRIYRMLLTAECSAPPASYTLRGTHLVLCTDQCATWHSLQLCDKRPDLSSTLARVHTRRSKGHVVARTQLYPSTRKWAQHAPVAHTEAARASLELGRVGVRGFVAVLAPMKLPVAVGSSVRCSQSALLHQVA
jgi:hypothetical protein